MLDSGEQILVNLLLSDSLEHMDADRSLVDREDAAGSAVVVLMRHTLVDGTVNDDIGVVSDSQTVQVGAHSG